MSISFSYYDEDVYHRQEGTPYLSSYKAACELEGKNYEQGEVYSSTDLILVR